jgi:hypothetical protein
MLYGGAFNTLRQCFLLDDQKRDVSRTNIYTGDFDRILTNQFYIDEDEIIGFGVERMHLFDRKTQKFTARCYDFAYDDDMKKSRYVDYYEVESGVDSDCEEVSIPKKRPRMSSSNQESDNIEGS